MQAPPNPKAICHCLLLEDRNALALVDTGLGVLDVRQPVERLGQPLIDAVGLQFDERQTAVRQVEQLGFSASDVKHIILTHCDPDHTGGLADFPHAQVHVSKEEHAAALSGHWRYVPVHFAHGPLWKTCSSASRQWFGLEARRLDLGLDSEVLLIPFFGHTLGHCGVAIRQDAGWTLLVGDAYYLRIELTSEDHPVCQLAAQRADNDVWRRASLEQIRRLVRDHAAEIDLFGYHDPAEFPA
jgi:glyoxylase-like metal-dependent hydrolase (beta-lactamase superfamily II)